MLKIEVKKKNIERALKELKRKFIKTKSLQECRDRKYHTKKSVERRQKINIEENVKMYFNDQRQKEFIRFVPFDRRYIWASLAFIRPYSGSALICLFRRPFCTSLSYAQEHI